MAYTLFYIVGNSDVQINNARIDTQNYRQKTQKLLEEVKKLPEIPSSRSWKIANGDGQAEIELSFPIIQSLLTALEQNLSKIVLIATDQKAHSFCNSDTLYAAELLKLFITAKYGFTTVIEITHDNPSDYDLMYQYFGKLFERYKKEIQTNLGNFVSISAGTPAMVHAFSLLSLPFPFSYYYVSRDRKTQRIAFYENINKKRYAETMLHLIETYHYKAALHQLQNSPLRNQKNIENLLHAAIARFSFDWQGALTSAQELPSPEREYFRWISYLQKEEKSYYLLEMLAHLEIALQVEDYQLFIAWLFNILENLRAQLIKIGAHVTIKKNNNDFSEWNEFMDKYPEFFSDKDRERKIADRTTIQKALKGIQQKLQNNTWEIPLTEKQKQAIGLAISFLDRLENEKAAVGERQITIQDLRNDGPFAHGYRGVNAEYFDDFWKPHGLKGLLEDLKKIIDLIADEQYSENPFKKINLQLKTYLRPFLEPSSPDQEQRQKGDARAHHAKRTR